MDNFAFDHINPQGRNIRFIVATDQSEEDFYRRTALGRTLKFYELPFIEVALFPQSKRSLPECYNTAIEAAKNNPAILIFARDYTHILDFYWIDKLIAGLSDFSVVTLAGAQKRQPLQPHWRLKNPELELENHENLSGAFGIGAGYPIMRLESFGPPGLQVELLDAGFFATQSVTLVDNNIRFDPQFTSDILDLDFSRTLQRYGVICGTFPLATVREIFLPLGTRNWQSEFVAYLKKWPENE